MRFKDLDLNLLVVLDALLTDKSVSAAAKRLSRSQPTISGALAKLREHFQDELLVHVGHRMVPTALAESMIVPIHRLIEQIDEAVDVGSLFTPETSYRTFRICITDQILDVIMPQVSSEVARQAPHVVLEMMSAAENTATIIENGETDLLIIPEPLTSLQFDSELLYEEENVMVGWRDNPHLSPTMTPQEFFALSRVAGRFGRARRLSTVELQMQKFSGGQNIEVVTPSFSSIPHLIIGTERVALMHRTLANFYASYLPLVVLPLPVETRPMRMMMQNHPGRNNDVGLEWLKRIIREAVALKRSASHAIGANGDVRRDV